MGNVDVLLRRTAYVKTSLVSWPMLPYASCFVCSSPAIKKGGGRGDRRWRRWGRSPSWDWTRSALTWPLLSSALVTLFVPTRWPLCSFQTILRLETLFYFLWDSWLILSCGTELPFRCLLNFSWNHDHSGGSIWGRACWECNGVEWILICRSWGDGIRYVQERDFSLREKMWVVDWLWNW